MALLEIKNLSFRYEDGFTVALEHLVLEYGKVAALVGVSGSGKSTLLECIGLLNLGFRSELFAFRGQRVSLSRPRHEIDAIRVQNIGYMPQNSALLPFLTVKENIMYQIRLVHGKMGKVELEGYMNDMGKYLTYLKMGSLMDKMPHEISVGQRQRASFLKAIAAKPKLLLIDEPTSSLDRRNAITMFACIKEIVKKENIGALVVTHDVNGVRDFQIYEHGDTDNIFRSHAIASTPDPTAHAPRQVPAAARTGTSGTAGTTAARAAGTTGARKPVGHVTGIAHNRAAQSAAISASQAQPGSAAASTRSLRSTVRTGSTAGTQPAAAQPATPVLSTRPKGTPAPARPLTAQGLGDAVPPKTAAAGTTGGAAATGTAAAPAAPAAATPAATPAATAPARPAAGTDSDKAGEGEK